MLEKIKSIDEIFSDLITQQTMVIEKIAKSNKTGAAAVEEIQKAIEELALLPKKAASDIEAAKTQSRNVDEFLKFVSDTVNTGVVVGNNPFVSPDGPVDANRSVIVETHGNHDANMAIASLFAKAEDIGKLAANASFFAVIFCGKVRRIVWDSKEHHAVAIKDISEIYKGIRKVSVGEAIRILKSTAPEQIEKHRLEMSDVFFKLYCHGLKAEALKRAAHDLKDSGPKTQSKEPASTVLVKVPWSPKIGELVFYREVPGALWKRGFFCGLSKKNAYIENGVLVKEISPALVSAIGSVALPRSYQPIFRVNNRRLVQVA